MRKPNRTVPPQSAVKKMRDTLESLGETKRRNEAQITSLTAQQTVTQYVMQELSTQLGGDTPELTTGEHVYWSVPVILTLPGKGVLGRVGILQIDAGTGKLLTDPQTEREMMRHAEQLAQRATFSAGA